MHPHATIADHNLGIEFGNNTCMLTLQSQQISVLFSINDRIRLLSLKSERCTFCKCGGRFSLLF